jgi:tetratricopeptide (TPR) repeat protein/SAM-dependent methyltransferase
MKANDPNAELFAAAFRHHQAGALREAEQTYKRVLALDPSHVDALHFLGVLAHQAGRSDVAAELIGRAISINDRIPESHYNLGLALGALGRFEEAAEHNRKAIGLMPDYAEAYLNLGNALKAQGKNEEAISNYERALALHPRLAIAHFNWANALCDLGRLDEAEKNYRKALAIQPDYAEAMTNLGSILGLQGKIEEAETQHKAAIAAQPNVFQAHANLGNLSLSRREYDRAIDFFRIALSINPAFAEAHVNLASALWAVNKKQEALESLQKAFTLKPNLMVAFFNFIDLLLESDRYGDALQLFRFRLSLEDTSEMRILYAWYLGNSRAIPYADEFKDILMRGIAEHWGNSRGLVDVSLHVLARKPSIASILTRAVDEWPSRPSAAALLGKDGLDALADDDLLRIVLTCERINSPEYEKFLSTLRSALLELVSRTSGLDLSPKHVSLVCALAQQCFMNEYVYFVPKQEATLANHLRQDLRNDLRQHKTISPAELAVAACYFSLSSIEEMEFADWSNSPADIKKLVQQQVLEPRQEREYCAIIPQLTAISNEVSKKVREQYEENPYPRWVRVSSNLRRAKLKDYLQQLLPNLPFPRATESANYLIAGCGTGQQVASLLSHVEIENILAIDLSLPSLAYAKRMLNELGITQVEYGQADILRLPELGRIFDVIETTGVLHHLDAPEDGWKALLSILTPGGLMRVSFYSEIARGNIIAARREITKSGYGDTADEIRAFRQKLMSMDPATSIYKVTQANDFFSLSECRDLLFHVLERNFTLEQIGQFISENGLVFLGLELPIFIKQLYAQQFPNDKAGNDLNSWKEFEILNPDTFIGMYNFWIQKKSTG